MFGLGPGAVSEAADGLVMRVLGEFGFAGLVAYTLHWLALYRIVRQRVTAPEGVSLGLLALFAQALVLDVLYFSRVAYLVYTCVGLAAAQAREPGIGVWVNERKGGCKGWRREVTW